MALGKFFSVQIGMDFSGGSWEGGEDEEVEGGGKDERSKRKEEEKGEGEE